MKISNLAFALFLTLMVTLSGCDFVGDVLEFGFWTIIIIIAILVLIVVGIVKMFRR
ncbi:MAG: hypothetical protein ACNS60_19290 [Candidatus Cyclobacteriaceae bacterium M2_1C_046]